MPAKIYSDKDADLSIFKGKTAAVLGFGGVAGTAAQFAWHVSDLMNKDGAYRRRSRVPLAARRVA